MQLYYVPEYQEKSIHNPRTYITSYISPLFALVQRRKQAKREVEELKEKRRIAEEIGMCLHIREL